MSFSGKYPASRGEVRRLLGACASQIHERIKSVARLGIIQRNGRAGRARLCNRLYAIEREAKALSPEKRYIIQMEQSRPILDAFSAWLHKQQLRVIPQSLTGKAVTYCLNQWEKLEAYLLDGPHAIAIQQRCLARFGLASR